LGGHPSPTHPCIIMRLFVSVGTVRLSPTRDDKIREAFALLPCTQWMPLQCKIRHLQQQSCRGKIIACSPLLLRATCEVTGERGERTGEGGSQLGRLAGSPWLLEGEEDEGRRGGRLPSPDPTLRLSRPGSIPTPRPQFRQESSTSPPEEREARRHRRRGA
jgi:hypothetical protein